MRVKVWIMVLCHLNFFPGSHSTMGFIRIFPAQSARGCLIEIVIGGGDYTGDIVVGLVLHLVELHVAIALKLGQLR